MSALPMKWSVRKCVVAGWTLHATEARTQTSEGWFVEIRIDASRPGPMGFTARKYSETSTYESARRLATDLAKQAILDSLAEVNRKHDELRISLASAFEDTEDPWAGVTA